jgi:8-oxo-dGTP diphosphatase
LRKDGRVLLCRRARDRAQYPGVWDVPGGHVEALESPRQALIRELQEELGITAEVTGNEPWATAWVDDVEFSIFAIDRWQGEPRNLALHEHDEVRWVSVLDLAGLDLAHPSYVDLLTRAAVLQVPHLIA